MSDVTVTNPSGVTSISGSVNTVSGLNDGGAFGVLNLPTALTPVEAKIGATALANRKLLLITIQSAGIFWGLDSSVTISTGQPTTNGQVLTFNTNPNAAFKVFLVCNANNKNVVVTEVP